MIDQRQQIDDMHVVDLLEDLYPKLAGQIDLIRLIVQVYRQIQQEAFGIVLINRKHQVSCANVRMTRREVDIDV